MILEDVSGLVETIKGIKELIGKNKNLLTSSKDDVFECLMQI